MTDASLRYEIEQLKRKLLQTQEERDRAMSNCHELWKRLNSLISLAASTTASYTLSSSGLPTSPSDSYDSRSKSTSPNSSSAASLNDSLLSTSNGTTTSNNSTHLSSNGHNNTLSSSNGQSHNNNNNNINKLNSNGNNQQQTTQNHHSPLNLKSVNAIKSNNNNSVFHTSNLHQLNGSPNNNNNNLNNNNNSNATNNNISNHNHLNSNGNSHNNNNNHHNNNHHHHTPLNLKSVNAIKDINNNHPLIAEVAKVTTVGEIEEIAPGQFKCRYCDKCFDRIFSVHRHERVHTGFKPCICKACGRGFSEKRNLRHHIIRFHSDGSGRELLKRNRNKSAAVVQHQQTNQAKQQIKHLSAAAQFLSGNQNLTNGNSNNNTDHPNNNNNAQQQQQQLQQHLIDSNMNSSLLSNNAHLSSTASSQITATINRLQNIKNEPLDTSGLNVLGAAAAVITVSSSSSRRRKSKPSKKINY